MQAESMCERVTALGAFVPTFNCVAPPDVLALAFDCTERIVLRLDGKHQKNVLSSSTASQWNPPASLVMA